MVRFKDIHNLKTTFLNSPRRDLSFGTKIKIYNTKIKKTIFLEKGPPLHQNIENLFFCIYIKILVLKERSRRGEFKKVVFKL